MKTGEFEAFPTYPGGDGQGGESDAKSGIVCFAVSLP
jgi:hypothetical protein